MNPKIKYWLRWIAVLPGAIFAGIISMFVLHLFLYYTLKQFIEPYPEMPERILTPFCVWATIIIIANSIAPVKNIWMPIVLFGLGLFFIGGMTFISFTGGQIFGYRLGVQLWGLPTVFACAGAGYGLYYVIRENRELQTDN